MANRHNSGITVGSVGFYKHIGPKINSLKKDDFCNLTSEEKRFIFRKNVSLHTSARKKGTAILRRLRTLAPATAERFELKRDPINNLTMRLWYPQGTTTDRPNSYICLSYCWNHERSSTIGDSEVSLPTSELMFSAFAAQRRSNRTGLWVDQICIDQKNAAEKAMSVSAMDAVYRCAERVVVVLHDVELPAVQQRFIRLQVETEGDSWWLDSKGFFRHVTDMPPYFEQYPVLKRLLYAILASKYFTRAWCSHELQIRGKYVFCMPCQPQDSQSPPTEVFYFTSDFLLFLIALSSKVPMGVSSAAENERIKEIREKVGSLLELDHPHYRLSMTNHGEDVVPRAMLSYPARIREIFSLGAGGDPGLPSKQRLSSALLDKSTIVLNILNNGLAIKRKSNQIVKEENCIEDLYMIGLAANDPLTLCTMGQHFYYGNSNKKLSWLRSPAYIDQGCGGERGGPSPCMIPQLTRRIELDPSPQRRWIATDVFALGPARPVDMALKDLALAIVDKCLLMDMGRAPSFLQPEFEDPAAEFFGKTDVKSRFMLLLVESMNSWGPGPEYQYWYSQTVIGAWRERFVWTIACILECGPLWIVQTALRCGFPALKNVGQKTFAIIDANDGTWDISKLKSMSWAENESEVAAVNSILSFANWMVVWGNDRAYGMNSECLPAIFAHGPAGRGHAVIYFRPDALLQMVVPTCLLEDHYARFYRVWQLEALDDPVYERMHRGGGAEWFLRAKAILFTNVEDGDTVSSNGSAADGKPGWRYRPGVRVHGPPRSVGEALDKHLKNIEPKEEDPVSPKESELEAMAKAMKISQ